MLSSRLIAVAINSTRKIKIPFIILEVSILEALKPGQQGH